MRSRTYPSWAATITLLAASSIWWRAGASAETPPGPYVTFLFSRTEISAADGPSCTRDDRSVATLGGVVAPYMASLGLAGTGSIQTGKTQQSTLFCTHYGETLDTSWDRAGWIARSFGWRFVSHSATYATHWDTMSPDRIMAETCGSAQTIDAHALPGAHGLFAYPSDSWTTEVQRDYVSTCFAFGRQYSPVPTTQEYALTPPYFQHTKGINGGACNDRSPPCWSIHAQGNENGHYNLPSSIISTMQQLTPGTWYTIQVYLLVTGKSPPYMTNPSRWDCTSADPRQHWTNDNERYCWNDFQRILNAIPSSVVVTDPLTVAHEFGRPGY